MSLEEILPNIYKQKVVGSLLRYLRKEKCASARHLAEASSTSVSYYYEIENGAKHISEGKILEIMAIMKEHLSFTENADLPPIFEDFINYYVIGDIVNARRCLDLIKNEDKYKLSYDYPVYILACFINDILAHKFDSIFVDELLVIYKCMGSTQRCVSAYFLGVCQSQSGHFEEALNYMIEAKSFELDQPDFMAMVYWEMAMIFAKLNVMTKAIEYNNKAYNIIVKTCNVNKLPGIILNLGNEYSALSFTTLASKQYRIALETATRNGNKLIMGMAKRNLIFTYLYRDKFQNVINFVKKGETIDGRSECAFTWAYYKLGKMNECLLHHKKILANLNDSDREYATLMYRIIKMKIENSYDDTYEAVIKEFYKYCVKKEYPSEQIFSINLLIDHYKYQKKYKAVAEYYELLLKYHEVIDNEIEGVFESK